MKNIFYFLFPSLFLSYTLFAQEEYLVQVNPGACSYSIIDSISGVKFIALSQSTFDKINKRYIFRGQDNTSKWFLYSIDAINGHIIFNPQFPNGNNNFGNIRFDNSSGILYGLHLSGTNTYVDFISINPANFNYTVINTINLTAFDNDATIDEINHRFIFTADDSIGNHCLFSIDAITGNVISKPQFPTPNIMGYFAFDNSSGIIYGIRLSSAPLSSVFVSIDPVNSNYTIIDTIPYDLSGGISMGNTSFDELNKRYTFSAMDNNNNLYLYTIDATNGQIISNPSFPVFVAPYNLIETKYDNSSGNLYALHWGQNSELTTGIEGPNQNSEVIIFPNPSSGKFVVQCANVKIQSLKMYNMLGELVYSTTQLNLVIDLSSQPNGVYFIHIISERGRAVKKVVINK